MNNADIVIDNGQTVFEPGVEGEITWETERRGSPGKLSFKITKGGALDFFEGNPVRLDVDGKSLFYGYVFTKKRDKDGHISVTAYDGLRYLKNKDTYIYTDMTATAVIRMIAADFNLRVGHLDESGYVIPKKAEDNKTMFDIIQNALDETLRVSGKMFVLYDDFGSLTLRDTGNMHLNILIDAETGENFDYTSSIDTGTYNQIKLSYENKETNKRDIYMVKDTGNINAWGVLQHFETIDENTDGILKAEALMKLYNKKTRNLTVSKAFGDVNVRGGSLVGVHLDLGDMPVQNYMMVEKVKHTFENKRHTMDLSLRGGEFIT